MNSNGTGNRRFDISRSALCLGASAAAMLMAGGASAQEAQPELRRPAEGEIVVTARRREERLIDVPVTAFTLSAEAMDRYQTRELHDLARQVPTLSVTNAVSSPGASIGMRGIRSTNQDGAIEQAVAVNLDGVVVTRGRVVNLGFLDVQNVEVLAGPQALFFGKNSPGGVVSLSSVDPGTDFSGYARAGYGFEAAQQYFEGAVTVPITEEFRTRFALRVDEQDGYFTNVAEPIPDTMPGESGNLQPADRNHGSSENLIGRFTALYEPTPDFSLNFKLLGAHQERGAPTSGQVVTNCAAGATVPTTYGVPDPFGDCVLDYNVVDMGLPASTAVNIPFARDGVPYFELDTVLTSLTATHQSGPIAVTSVTGYYYFENEAFDSYDYTGSSFLDASGREVFRSLSQEFRIASSFETPLNFTAGVFLSHDSRTFGSAGKFVNAGPDPRNGFLHNYEISHRQQGDTYSVFGQLIWDITPELELAGGARYTREEKTTESGNVFLNQLTPYFLAEGVVLRGELSADNISPEATLTWRPNRDMTFYAAYKTGYLSPIWSGAGNLGATATLDSLRVEEETADGVEIGAKGSFLDGRLTAELSIYQYNFEGLQATTFDAPTVSFVTKNVGEARTQGFDLVGSFRATDALTLRGSVSYTDAQYISYANAQCWAGQTAPQGCVGVGRTQDLSGRQLDGTPEWQARLGATWEQPIGDLRLELSGDAFYKSEYNYNQLLRPDRVQDGFARVDLSARLSPEDGPWEVSLIGRNVTDELYIIFAQDKPGGTPGDMNGSIGDPREIVLQFGYNF